MKYVVDTNVLLDSPEVLDDYDVILPITVLEEIDKLKLSRDKAHKARRAARKIVESDVEYCLESVDPPEGWEKDKADNKILMCATKYDGIISNDLTVLAKGRALRDLGYNLEVLNYIPQKYTGIMRLTGTTEEINDYYANKEYKSLYENQYLVVLNKDTGEETEAVYRGGRVKGLKLPHSNLVKGKNAEQRCALDLLNSNVPIKIICGTAGSGKTFLAAQMGISEVTEGKKQKLVLVRQPCGVGEDIGFLPGNVEEKVGRFYAPIADSVDEGEEFIRYMEDKGQLGKYIPFHMKGITIRNSFVIVDEAEDMDLRTLAIIGARLGEGSTIVYCGDYKQAETKFLNNNGLVRIIQEKKGDSMVGIVVLEEDVRSDASKVFADLL